jgi:hypothetical protein
VGRGGKQKAANERFLATATSPPRSTHGIILLLPPPAPRLPLSPSSPLYSSYSFSSRSSSRTVQSHYLAIGRICRLHPGHLPVAPVAQQTQTTHHAHTPNTTHITLTPKLTHTRTHTHKHTHASHTTHSSRNSKRIVMQCMQLPLLLLLPRLWLLLRWLLRRPLIVHATTRTDTQAVTHRVTHTARKARRTSTALRCTAQERSQHTRQQHAPRTRKTAAGSRRGGGCSSGRPRRSRT